MQPWWMRPSTKKQKGHLVGIVCYTAVPKEMAGDPVRFFPTG
jgi:hypothetical protein